MIKKTKEEKLKLRREYDKRRNHLRYIKKHKISLLCCVCNNFIPENKPSTTKYCSDKCGQKVWSKTHRNKYGGRNHLLRYREIVIELLGGKCVNCLSLDSLQIDHTIPIFMGGNSEISNLQVLCKKCHKIKTKSESKCVVK